MNLFILPTPKGFFMLGWIRYRLAQQGQGTADKKNLIKITSIGIFFIYYYLDSISTVHRQTSYRDKPPNATKVLKTNVLRDKHPKGQMY